jgi:hypothetical protein
MNHDDNNAYCFGNLKEGLTYISPNFNNLVDSSILSELQLKLKNLTILQSSIKINNKEFLIFPLPDDKYFLLLNSNFQKDIKEITHDLNNVFNNINNALIILSKKISDVYEKRIIEGIKDNLNRGQYLLRKLTLNDDEEINLVDSINLLKILKAISNEICNSCSSDIKIINNFDENLNLVLANEEELYRAFFNICINAKEAITEKGEIIISAQNNEDKVIVTIKDTGVGINEGNLSKIFELGFSTKSKKTESGIGLSIVKKIIEKYKGTIEVISKENIGTTFIVTLPAITNNLTKEERSNKILVADDDEFMLDLLNELFSSYNYQIFTAKSGEEVLEILKKDNSIALLIIDQNMPGLKGLDIIKILRDNGNTSQIILCSGIKPDYSEEILRKLNIADVIIKPYDFDNLLNKVKNLL